MAKPRRIDGLEWAAVADRNPYPGPRRLRGSQAQGVAFQNKIGRFLAGQINAKRLDGQLFSDLWFMFADKNGEGFAQPDHFILQPERCILFECKLSQNSTAWPQMEFLYKPLLEHMFKRPVVGIQAFHRMKYEEPKRKQISIYGPKALQFEDGAIWHYYL